MLRHVIFTSAEGGPDGPRIDQSYVNPRAIDVISVLKVMVYEPISDRITLKKIKRPMGFNGHLSIHNFWSLEIIAYLGVFHFCTLY